MKTMPKMKRWPVILAVFLLVLMAGTAGAQAPPESQPGVGRISLIQGNVSVQHSDSGEWLAATPNLPVAPGDSISTGPGSRVEIQLDYANVLRLSENTTTKIANLASNQIQVQVGQGLVNYSVVRAGEAGIEIDTPNIAIRPAGAGSYRIQVNSDTETQFAVRAGAADVSAPQGNTRVERGQLITIRGTDSPQYQTVSAPGIDEWDRWNGDRDRLITGAASWQHTTPYFVGTQDLDPYGHWIYVNDYGNVWVPAQEPSWAPYRAGRWVSEPYYGWTWVSYEPWGWAPYHYGRWFVHGGSWAWWPGPVAGYPAYRPLWAPAYVSFLGFGSSFGVGIGFGNVGWLPIGPADSFFPWYGRFGGHASFVNVIDIYNRRGFDRDGFRGIGPLHERGFSNLREAFANERVRGGMTSMAGNQFGRAGVPLHQQGIDPGSLRQGRLMAGGLPMSPSRESYRPTDRAANPASIPSRPIGSQRFFGSSRSSAPSQPFGGEPARTNPAFNPAQSGRGFGAANPGANGSGANPATPRSGWNGSRFGNQGTPSQGFGPVRGQSPVTGTRPDISGPPSSGWRGFRGSQSGNPSVGQNDRPPAARQNEFGGAGRGRPSFAPPGQGGGQTRGGPNQQAQPESGGRNFGGANGMQSSPPSPAPSFGPGRQGSDASPNPRGYSRPPLDLRQPIVRERGGAPAEYGRSGGGSRGGQSGGGGGRAGGGGRTGGNGRSDRGR